jgi:hypothetical protein
LNEKPNTTAGGDVARPAGSTGESLLTDAKNAVGHMAEGAKDQVVTRVEAQKDKAAEKIGSVAGALRAAGEPLAEIGPLPDLAGRAADQIESIAEYVQSRTVGDIVREVERFARREPAIFLGAAFGMGLLAGRFLKSSPRRSAEMQLTDHPEIQDEMFEEEISFGSSNLGRSGLDRSGVGRFETSRRETGWTSSAGGNTWGERSVERDNPGVDRTMNSGFGGYGGSYATGTSTAYDTTGSSVSAKPASDLGSSSYRTEPRGEGATTKPMGTFGDSSVTAATPSTSSTAGNSSSLGSSSTSPGSASSGSTGSTISKPIGDSPLTASGGATPEKSSSSTPRTGNGTSASSNGTTRSTNR